MIPLLQATGSFLDILALTFIIQLTFRGSSATVSKPNNPAAVVGWAFLVSPWAIQYVDDTNKNSRFPVY